ncbi:HlyD family efflux transporter periplasmic adaptor subunit [Calothrix sp. UHCC 0171]|uniref:HlyD family efflux transporter periplasmic adaptor subunit n=1 Tax=Calothrix sp. UHCC 0171 TaxID=3110245 RepID=UPI002B20C5C4|nr:HlyD family efflux transporter periplasmic adaptor subunit [Calothrix sp. UHCC 0171]MEA5573060.1 HlyD family efflux transporter periplasmic adaptor subunit [Calothrix sp. UHCC 0171]
MTKLDTNNLNGKSSNSKFEHTIKTLEAQTLTTESQTPQSVATKSSTINSQDSQLEQSVVLRQSPIWSRAIMGTMMGLVCFGITWAYFAKIEQVIPATGQLKPEGAVKEIQAPVSGVVKDIYIKDGQQVKAGDLLLVFDSTTTDAELGSLQKIRAALIRENQIYRQLIQNPTSVITEEELLKNAFAKETISLLKHRTVLLSENEFLRKELGESGNNFILGIDEQKRFIVTKNELDTRAAAGQLEVAQIRKKLAQIEVQISDTKATVALEEQIIGKLKTLSEEGGISQLQYLQQQKKVQNLKAQVAQLQEEKQRLQLDIQQGEQELKNSVAASHKNNWEKITNHKKQIAEIESQLTKVLLENEKRLADVNSKISQVQTNIKYQRLYAPVAGTIFNLQANNHGFVTRPSEKLLSIVPNDSFIAEAFITNKDIGFIREGMKTDVRIDSFPFSEFGDIKGEIISVASDALPPDENYRYYRFPIKIKLDRQSLNVQGKNISLQSGMSITANIKIREERSIMSLFTEVFTKQIETLKEVR